MPRHPKNHTKRSKRSKRTKRSKHSGGAGFGYEPGGPLLRGTQLDAMVTKPYDGCMTVNRPGQMSYSATGGLPGMRGGAYTTALNGSIPGLAQYDKLPCDTSLSGFNPLNKHFAQAGGVGLQSASDMGVYEAHSARYSQSPSSWTNSVGAPVLNNVPLSSTLWSRACTQTAGRRRGVKKSRKTKKSGRRKQRGGDLKEDALEALKSAGKDPNDLAKDLYTKKTMNRTKLFTASIGGFTFKHQTGYNNSKLMAKQDGANDSTYVEISIDHWGSQ